MSERSEKENLVENGSVENGSVGNGRITDLQ
jgi:hypothetical protein